VITLFAGLGLGTFLYLMGGHIDSEPVWAVGVIPVFVGIALLLSSWIVWPRGNAGTSA
jgi:hypothetical protein